MDAAAQAQWVMDLLAEGEEDEMAFNAIMAVSPSRTNPSARIGGSYPGRAPNKKRDPHGRHFRLLQQYFAPDAVYNDRDFRNRFRISKSLYSVVHRGVVETDEYFVQKPNAAGKVGISSLLKVTAAIRVLAYASAADSIDENLEMSDSTVLECVKHFCQAIIVRFGGEYLRPPNPTELEGLLTQNAQRGFVGMLGSIDCMHWEWRNCPSAQAGQHKGKEKKPTKVLEAVADKNLRIWHCNFGSPGSLNDINILDQSSIFDDILSGRALRAEFSLRGK